jgi:hypothetical protein
MQRPGMTREGLMILLASVIWTVSCEAQQPNPKPKFTVVDSVRPSNEELRSYLASLRFLTDHVSGDLRMLDADHPSSILRVDPAADNNTGYDLRRSGRVVTRLVNRGTASIERFALAPRGTTYFWVQNVGGHLRGVLISTDSAGAILGRFPVSVTSDTTDHPARAAQPLARLRTDPMAKVLAQCAPGCAERGGWCKGDSVFSATWLVEP